MAAEIPKHWLHEETLTPRDVGKIFDVDARTVTKWATNGIIGFFRTPNGLRRYPVCEVQRLMAAAPPDDPELLLELARIDQQKYHEMWRGGWRRGVKVTEIKDDQ
jgi:hypothetical protein